MKIKKEMLEGKELKLYYDVVNFYIYDLDEWDLFKDYDEIALKNKKGDISIFPIHVVFALFISMKKESKVVNFVGGGVA